MEVSREQKKNQEKSRKKRKGHSAVEEKEKRKKGKKFSRLQSWSKNCDFPIFLLSSRCSTSWYNFQDKGVFVLARRSYWKR